MNRLSLMISSIVIVVCGQLAHGHGTPITVTTASSTLVVSSPITGGDGFAPVMFAQSDSDGDAFNPPPLPQVGNVLVWQVPGFNISGLNEQSSLSIQVLARPVKDSNPI